MKTATWSPTAPVKAAHAPEFFTAGNEFIFVDDQGKRIELGYFTSLYAALASLRTRLACVVEYQGVELFAFDGDTITHKGDFGTTLADFEYFLVKERTSGYSDAIEWMEGVVENNKRIAELAANDLAVPGGSGTANPAGQT